VTAHVDDRIGIKPGAKYFHWELKGIPIRMEIGPRDVAANQCVLVRRDVKGKNVVSLDGVLDTIHAMLDTMQNDMFAAAIARREANSYRGEITYDRFKEIMDGPGGFVYAGWNGDPAVEARVKEETKATIRCIPDPEFRSPVAPTKCMVTGEPAKYEVIWAKAY
jgi:prolyl-tRNA synthetase